MFIMDAKREGEAEYQAFKNLIFASSRGPADPNLYSTLFDEERTLTPAEEEDIEWVTPDTEGDLQQMVSLMRQTGWSAA